MNIRTQYTPFH